MPPCLSSANHRILVMRNKRLKVRDSGPSDSMFSLNQNVCSFLDYCFFQRVSHCGRFCKKEITSVKKITFQSSILTSHVRFGVCGQSLEIKQPIEQVTCPRSFGQQMAPSLIFFTLFSICHVLLPPSLPLSLKP